MKVKIFDEAHEKDLEDEINKFLEEEEANVIDIKYAADGSVSAVYRFSAMIIYN